MRKRRAITPTRSDAAPAPETPETPEQWQLAVNLAEACLLFESARQYGLITGGPIVDVPRCGEILDEGQRRGITPTVTGVEQAIDAFIKESPRGTQADPP